MKRAPCQAVQLDRRSQPMGAEMLNLRTISAAVALFLYVGFSVAQESKPAHQLTFPVPSARFEILQSPLAARWTFRLDRYTGKVWQLVKTKDDDNTWEEMLVGDLLRSRDQ